MRQFCIAQKSRQRRHRDNPADEGEFAADIFLAGSRNIFSEQGGQPPLEVHPSGRIAVACDHGFVDRLERGGIAPQSNPFRASNGAFKELASYGMSGPFKKKD